MAEPSPLLEAFKVELEALLRRYPTVVLRVAQTIQAEEIIPQVEIPVAAPTEYLPTPDNGDTKTEG